MWSDTKNQLSKEDRDFIDRTILELKDVKTDNYNPSENLFMGEWYDEQERKGVNNEMITPIDDYGKYEIPATGSGVFLKVEKGETRIRILTKANEVRFHELGKGSDKYKTSLCTGEGCELCKAGNQFKVKYAFLVLKRNPDGKDSVHVYEAPKTVFKQIVTYDLNKEYGDVREYDLTISREGEKFDTVYTVIASPKKTPIMSVRKGDTWRSLALRLPASQVLLVIQGEESAWQCPTRQVSGFPPTARCASRAAGRSPSSRTDASSHSSLTHRIRRARRSARKAARRPRSCTIPTGCNTQCGGPGPKGTPIRVGSALAGTTRSI